VNNRSPLRLRKILVICIFFIAFVFYLPTLWHSFVWDDLSVLSSEIFGIKGYGLFLGGGDYYRPFMALFHGLDYAIWYTNPLGFHLTNIILNALCGVAAFFVFLVFSRESNPLLPFFATLLFIFHPVHADSVAWIAGRTDIIATLFFLLAFLAYMLYREENEYPILFLSALFFLFSLFGKEIGISLPLIVLLYDILIKQKKTREIVKGQIPLISVIIIYFLLREFPQPSVGAATTVQGHAGENYNLLMIINDVAYSFGFYIKKLLLPFNMSMFPDMYRIENIFFLAVFLLVLLVFIIKKQRTGTFSVLFILLTILPSMPVVFLKTVPSPVAVRYLYLPVFGFAMISAYGIDKLRPKYLKTAFLCIVIILYGISGSMRNMDWKKNMTLWSHEVKINSDSATAHASLGHALYDAKEYNRAEKEMLLVINNIDSMRVNRSIVKRLKGDCLNTLGLISIERKEFDVAKTYLLEAIRNVKRNRAFYHNLGTVYLSLYNDKKDRALLKEAHAMYREAAAIDPNYINSRYGLAYTADLLEQKEDAVRYYQEVINIDPRSPLAVMAYKAITVIQKKQK
jgi:protein O-mannosyl-transferase